MCPEILLNTGHDLTADLWAMGCLIFEILSGRPPFSVKSGNQLEIYRNILNGIDALEFPDRISRTPRHLSRNFVAKRRESDSELEKMELKKLKSKNGKRIPIIPI